ncbi:MAG: sigma-70 family RNA polymerase sigma factor [Actinobacteria bacterium]|nr:sigma-70 family RNA polymerase sigma factor [Actinomycetota bacterium]
MTEKRELARLIKRIQKGDADAFGQLYDRFHGPVYSYVLRQVGKPADAEDITSTVFLYVLEKIDGFTWRGAGFAAWLFRIARNDVLDHFRRHGTGAREIALPEDMLERPSGVLVEEQFETATEERRLLCAINGLSEEQRQVVLLKLMMNFSNRQVGEVLDKTEGAVKALTHRALQALRKEMEKQEGDPGSGLSVNGEAS